MARTTRTGSRNEYWRRVIAEQERSGTTVHGFCERRGISDQSFYVWRKRLREDGGPVRFALVEAAPAQKTAAPLELVLQTGDRLLIDTGVEAATLRTVLEALRA